MATPFTRINLGEVEDVAPANGFGERWEARVARADLDAEQTGVSHFRLHPGKRSPFVHRHERAEEVYVVLAGSGLMVSRARLAPRAPPARGAAAARTAATPRSPVASSAAKAASGSSAR